MLTSPLILPWKKAYGETANGRKTPPEIIYRYLPDSRVDSLIIEKYLYFSAPTKFNDPLDMHMGLLSFYLHKADARTVVEKIYPYLSGKAKKIEIEKIYSDRSYADKQKKELEEIRDRAGICCFSESPTIALMWSHYAGAHSGVCFGFNIEPFGERNNDNPTVYAVKYKEKIEAVSMYDTSPEAVGHWLLTKSHVWSYEHEIRAIAQYTNGKIEFDPRCLKEVYFGCRVESPRIAEIIDLLKANGYSGIKCYKMIIDESIFDIRPVAIDF